MKTKKLKKEALEIIIWILTSNGFEAYPGPDYKAKFHLKFIRKNSTELIPTVRILLSQLIELSGSTNLLENGNHFLHQKRCLFLT